MVTNANGAGEKGKKSTMIKPMFHKKLTKVFCADGGSDLKVLPPDVLNSLFRKNADMKVKRFTTVRRYDLAAKKDQDGY